MAEHSTNYRDTFIEVAEDCPADAGTAPPDRDPPTAAALQFSMLAGSPYLHDSDEVLFRSWAARAGVGKEALASERERYFSKGQPCMRASPLTKTYGWGVHSDGEGRIALYGRETEEYRRLAADPALRHLKAMKSRR